MRGAVWDATCESTPVRWARLVALALLVAAFIPAHGAIGQAVDPVALQSTLPETRHSPPGADVSTTATMSGGSAAGPLDKHPRYGESRYSEPRYGETRYGETRYGETPSSGRLPLYGALVGAVLLGGYAMSECVEIGCTTAVPLVLAGSAGAVAGALVGTVIQRLRATPAPRPTERPYSLVPRRTSKIALRLHEGHSSHSR